MASVGHDGVVATLHVFNCGSGSVSFSQVGTGGADVCAIKAKTMGPAIVHL